MHIRERGAAHVPMIFFVLILVMFLGALVFGYVKQTENGDLLKQRNDAKRDLAALQSKNLLAEHYIGDFGKVIGKPGAYTGRKSANYEGATLTSEGVMNPEEIKKVLDEASQRAELTVASSLENALGQLLAKIDALKQRVRDAEGERDKAMAEKSAVDRSYAEATTQASTKARDFDQQLEQTRADFTARNADQAAALARAQETLNQKNDELTTATEKAVAKEKFLNNEIAKHQMQLSAVTARDAMIKAPDVPDGKIIVAKNGIPKAFINLGRKDMLKEGTVFRIKNTNSAKVKGLATVTKVEDERSEVTLSNLVDPVGDYAREGDLLYNELFSPGVTRTIFLMGRFDEPYSKENLKNLLVRLGNRVVNKMAPGVDTVILGSNPVNEAGDGFSSVQESEEFKLASELRVEFAYLSSIRDLIKL